MVHRCNIGLKGGIREFFGIRTSPNSVFANHADHISSHVYSGLLTVDRLMAEHSLQPYFGAFTNAQDEQMWISRMRSSQISNLTQRAIPGGISLGSFRAHSLRCCIGCIESDYSRFGMPYWRVSHQFPPLKHCLEHHTALSEQCGACGMPFAGREMWLRLPGDACHGCGSNSLSNLPVPTSLGYSDLVSLFARLQSGSSLMRPAMRQEMRRTARSMLPRCGHLPSDLKKLFMQYWECESTDQLQEQLGCSCNEKSLLALLNAEDLTQHPNLIASTGEFLVRLLELPPPSDLGEVEVGHSQVDLFDDPLWVSAVSRIGEDQSRAYVRLATEVGLSERVALSLASGRSPTSITAEKIASETKMKVYVKVLQEHGLLSRRKRKLKWPDQAPNLQRVQLSQEGKRALLRDRLLLFIDRGPARRQDFFRFCSPTYKWLLKHDSIWFELMLPPMPRHLRRRAD